ncbi:MAG: UDP-3-O-(3-hydroxymyristoyl)glucosamine N-acyltransferase [Neisseriaceae bacterium]
MVVPKLVYLSELTARFGGKLVGADIEVRGISSLQEAGEEELTFYTDPKLRFLLKDTKAKSLIVGVDFQVEDYPQKSFIITQNPYLYYARISRFFYPLKPANGTRHPSAVIDSDQIDDSVEIGPLVVIGSGVKIGENTRILAGCIIEAGVEIGQNCLIHPQVTLLQGVKVGDDVEIHSGAVIGSDGFGLAWTGESWEKIPQVGGVEIQNSVEIGANVCIDRGAIGNTVIRTGVKVDNLVQIAHNCDIGEHTALAGMVGLAGSTKIGARCRIAGAAKTVGHLEIAEDTFIAGACIVSRSIKQPGGKYAGSYPFQEYHDWQYNAACLKQLRAFLQRLKQLERAMAENDTRR